MLLAGLYPQACDMTNVRGKVRPSRRLRAHMNLPMPAKEQLCMLLSRPALSILLVVVQPLCTYNVA